MIRSCLVVCFCFLLLAHSYGQTNPTIDSFKLKGHWMVCTSLQFSEDFNCAKGYMTYEFFENGTFKDPRPSFDGNGHRSFSLGKWTLINDTLTIDYDDTEFSQAPPLPIKIIFLTNEKFYSMGREGENGVMVYTYFQKLTDEPYQELDVYIICDTISVQTLLLIRYLYVHQRQTVGFSETRR